MNAVRSMAIGMRLLGAGLAYLFFLSLSYGLIVRAPASRGVEPIPVGVGLLLMGGVTTAVVGWLILRSRLAGWPLAGTMIVLVFGVQTFMPQVESLLFQAYPGFARHMPAAMVPRLFLAGLLHAVLWSPVAVLILGRWRGAASDRPAASPTPRSEWAWKLPLAALIYVAFYFTFGYYVAWRSPAVTAYYEGTDPGTFWKQMGSVLGDAPWLPAAQVVRGLLWTALAVLVTRTTRGSTLEKALAVGALFALVMNVGLLLPNPYMPYEVRMVHLVETASSNFLFGALLVWMLARR